MGPPEIKICGITQPADAALCARLGVDYVGLNFYPKSPRCITVERAKEIIAAAPGMKYIAVLVEPSSDDLHNIVQLHIDVARVDQHQLPPGDGSRNFIEPSVSAFQIHGIDRTGCLQTLRHVGWPLILAVGAAHAEDWHRLQAWCKYCEDEEGLEVARLLVDAKVQGQHGGTGQTAPWHELSGWIDPKNDQEFFLAGGLTPENVAEAIRIVRPTGVDVASGVESVPGVKDPEKLEEFVAAVRGT